MYFWLCCNAVYALGTSLVVVGNPSTVSNDGSIGFLAGFSLFVAGLMLLRFIFAALYIIKWNLRMCFCSHYRKSTKDAEEAFKEIKSTAQSSDEEEGEDEENGMLFPSKEDESKRVANTHVGSDDDDEEFALADREENEDRFSIMSRRKTRFAKQRGTQAVTNNGGVLNAPKH